MKIIKDNEELKSYIVDGVAKFNESIECDFDICIDANIKAIDIEARNIEAHNIDARNIDSHNIKAINIEARNIKADDIEASNIDAHNIGAINIKAHNISYYAFCIAYLSLECSSIKGRRTNSIHKCLDKEIEIKKTEINLQGQTFKLNKSELENLKNQLK